MVDPKVRTKDTILMNIKAPDMLRTPAATLGRQLLGRQLGRIGTRALSTRTESDAFGPIEVPDNALWGAQTQRSIQNFPIGGSAACMPLPIIRAFGVLKKCAARYNVDTSKMDPAVGTAICTAADEVSPRKPVRSAASRSSHAGSAVARPRSPVRFL